MPNYTIGDYGLGSLSTPTHVGHWFITEDTAPNEGRFFGVEGTLEEVTAWVADAKGEEADPDALCRVRIRILLRRLALQLEGVDLQGAGMNLTDVFDATVNEIMRLTGGQND